MDELGVDRTLMFPTLASLLEERMRDDPELTHAAIHSLNEWMHEEWTFNYEDRIFTVPVITLPIVEKAIEELEWVLERGAKTISSVPPRCRVPGLTFVRLPEFDPFWKAVEDADISSPCTPRTAATPGTRATGPVRARCCRSAWTPSGS